MTVKQELETQKVNPDVWNDVMPQNGWSLVVQLSSFCPIPLICRQLRLNSLFLCSFVRMLTLVVLDWLLKMEEFLHKMVISLSDLKSWTA